MAEKGKLSISKVISYLVFAWGLAVLTLYSAFGYFSKWLAGEEIEFSARRLEALNGLSNDFKLAVWVCMTCVILWFALFVSKGIYARNRSSLQKIEADKNEERFLLLNQVLGVACD